MEIERKFLVTEVPEGLLETAKRFEIAQGYFVSSEGRKERIRAKVGEEGEALYLRTYKEGDGLVRIEDEWKITKDEFDRIWPQTEGARVEKTRYMIPLDRHVAELDLYKAGLDPLMTVEVEFTTEEDAQAFLPPEWFGEDVTGIRKYTNSQLAQ
jgi:adenylate cyclase